MMAPLRQRLGAVRAELVDAAGEAGLAHPDLLDHGVRRQPPNPRAYLAGHLDHRTAPIFGFRELVLADRLDRFPS